MKAVSALKLKIYFPVVGHRRYPAWLKFAWNLLVVVVRRRGRGCSRRHAAIKSDRSRSKKWFRGPAALRWRMWASSSNMTVEKDSAFKLDENREICVWQQSIFIYPTGELHRNFAVPEHFSRAFQADPEFLEFDPGILRAWNVFRSIRIRACSRGKKSCSRSGTAGPGFSFFQRQKMNARAFFFLATTASKKQCSSFSFDCA